MKGRHILEIKVKGIPDGEEHSQHFLLIADCSKPPGIPGIHCTALDTGGAVICTEDRVSPGAPLCSTLLPLASELRIYHLLLTCHTWKSPHIRSQWSPRSLEEIITHQMQARCSFFIPSLSLSFPLSTVSWQHSMRTHIKPDTEHERATYHSHSPGVHIPFCGFLIVTALIANRERPSSSLATSGVSTIGKNA